MYIYDTLNERAQTGMDAEPSDVNYNDGATELYKHIENRRWREAAERCRTEPLETKIWVYRMDKRNKKVLWRMLPIHTAILYRAPVYVILDLIEANPEGPMQSDDRKMLPIHMACRVICKEDVLRVLVKHKIETVVAKDAKGRTPRDILLDDKRDQESKVLKKVAERNKKNLLKILKEYEVIYERKTSAASVASFVVKYLRDAFQGVENNNFLTGRLTIDEDSIMGRLYSGIAYHSTTTKPVMWEITIQLDAKLITKVLMLLCLVPLPVSLAYSMFLDSFSLEMFLIAWALTLITTLFCLRPVAFVKRRTFRTENISNLTSKTFTQT
jgi:hypothetical protein